MLSGKPINIQTLEAVPGLGARKKYQPQSAQRTQSFFFLKAKNMNNFGNIPSSLRPPGSLRFMVLLSFSD